MARPEEVSAWSIPELQGEIRSLLPEGWTMTSRQDPSGYWSVTVHRIGESQEPVVEMVREHADQRLALLNVFGELWLQKSPQPSVDSPWVRRNEPRLNIVTRAVVKGSHIADPEDLDPLEIERAHKTRK